MTTTFDDLLHTYRNLSDSERMKGSYLEQLVEQYLRNDGVQAPQYKEVWLWRDWPERPVNFTNKDNGIDLVGLREDGVSQLSRSSSTNNTTASTYQAPK